MSLLSFKKSAKKLIKKTTANKRWLPYALNLLAVIAAGTALYVISHAATSAVSLEAEGGNRDSMVHLHQDGSASKGYAIHFGHEVTTGDMSTILPNTYLDGWMNARKTTANTTPTACVNLECSETGDNGSSPQGQFRVGCQYSHFNFDDPIVYPGQPGKAHLHMFWGNTHVDANTHYDPNDTSQNSLTKYGGGSCQGAELNRTAYWMPALMDGNGNVVVPKSIVVYYKTNNNTSQAQAASILPAGLKMIGGNSKGNTNVTGYRELEWNCYDDSASWTYPLDAYGNTAGRTIPATCPSGHWLHSIISFPQCYRGSGFELTDTQFQDEQQNCPSGWVHMPQVQYIIDWPKSPTGSYANWYLSSDRMMGQTVKPNGSTLHGDWFGGWNDTVMNTWTNGCIRALRNCSLGQMGGSNLHLKRLPKDPTTNEDYPGPFFLPAPSMPGM